MGTKKGQVRKTARRAYEPKKKKRTQYRTFSNFFDADEFANLAVWRGKAKDADITKSKRGFVVKLKRR
tara:strand:- start:2337 stop:2540 length:204 start_codon:yes stop_codon:yes gene_type:complete